MSTTIEPEFAGVRDEWLPGLSATVDDQQAEEYRRGHGDGIVWAGDYATSDELRDLVEKLRARPAATSTIRTGEGSSPGPRRYWTPPVRCG